MTLHLVPTPPAEPDLWATLTAATHRPDVPADVQAAITGALAYRDEIVDQLDEITDYRRRMAAVYAREQACAW